MQLISPACATGSRQTGQTPPIVEAPPSLEKRPAFRVEWASTAQDVREAQRLRYQVFVGEMGAVLQAQERSVSGHDIDPLDDFCEHLLVRADGGAHEGEVIATCRVLSPAGALRAGHRYTNLEFDLAPIEDLLPHTLEMGRVCVHREWRNGLLVMALWREIGLRMSFEQLDTLIGCCSVALEAEGAMTSSTITSRRRIAGWPRVTL
jgi:putative hemolysin